MELLQISVRPSNDLHVHLLRGSSLSKNVDGDTKIQRVTPRLRLAPQITSETFSSNDCSVCTFKSVILPGLPRDLEQIYTKLKGLKGQTVKSAKSTSGHLYSS